jgi:hypothetical protein
MSLDSFKSFSRSKLLSEFSGPPLEIEVKRTKRAHSDFADWRISEERQNTIARQLKQVPRSEADRFEGAVRLRSVEQGFEVAFMLIATDGNFTVLIIGFDREGQMESQLGYIKRAALEGMHPSVKTLIEGRRR